MKWSGTCIWLCCPSARVRSRCQPLLPLPLYSTLLLPLLRQRDMSVVADAAAALVERMVASAGSTPAEAAVVASHLVAANTNGHDSHGVGMMDNYTDQLLNGAESSFGCKIVPNDQPTIITDTGSMLIMEAGGKPSPVPATA